MYLEALDREVKKENENPSVGVILCASKDDEAVEFALSRSLSPTMVSEYNLKLIDKTLLQKKLKEYIDWHNHSKPENKRKSRTDSYGSEGQNPVCIKISMAEYR